MTLASNLSPGAQWVSAVRALLGGPVGRLLDIGSDRVTPDYSCPDLAERITCRDLNPRIIPPTPKKIEMRAGNLLDMDIAEYHGPTSFILALALHKGGPETRGGSVRTSHQSCGSI